MSTNNNRPNAKTSNQLTQSWSHTLSDYLLQRRAQTQLAYQTAFNAQIDPTRETNSYWGNPKAGAKNLVRIAEQGSVASAEMTQNTDWLFKALFIALAQQLEEGHTVLTLRSNDSFKKGATKTSSAPAVSDIVSAPPPLQLWQRQLLTLLLSPLMDYIDTTEMHRMPVSSIQDVEREQISDQIADEATTDNHSVNEEPLHQILTLWPQIALQLALPPEHKAALMERHRLAQKLINYFADSLAADATLKNSLSKFVQLISQNDWFIQITPSTDIVTINSAPLCFRIHQTENSLSITLWLYRTWQAEHTLAKNIQRISKTEIKTLPITTNAHLNSEQQAAIDMANSQPFSIITGGPGTGKTYTVAQLVMALKDEQMKDAISSEQATSGSKKTHNTSLALAAPTGKAAQRMQESLQSALDRAGVSMQLQEAKTIHRLLGIGQGGRPRYHADNTLSEDIIIVDEASMLGVELANHLVSAIKPGARLILLGDANQLAAVDAGAVLADLCQIPMLQSMHQQLRVSRRFSELSGIGQLAKLINSTDADIKAVWQLIADDEAITFHPVNQHLETPVTEGIEDKGINIKNSLSNKKLLQKIAQYYTPYIKKIKQLLPTSISAELAKSKPSTKNDFTRQPSASFTITETVAELMLILNQFRILTAGHHGYWGDQALNEYISQWHKAELKLPISNSPWFPGRPVMVLQNSYEMGLFNGDIGICLQTSRGLEVFFENKHQGIAVNLLNEEMIATAYAMTIHKSQGSEFEHVAITFDDSNSRLLSKELIYTAVTRAKKQVSIYSSLTALEQAIKTPTRRQTGLALQFEEVGNDVADSI